MRLLCCKASPWKAHDKISHMFEFTLNGTLQQREQTLTIAALLLEMNLSGKRLAVEKNGQIVPRSQHDGTMIDAGCQLEIVVAVGGG